MAREASSSAVTPWDLKGLKEVDPREVQWSRGFLRCDPEGWFPSVSAQWLTLAHTVGVSLKLLDVQQGLKLPIPLSTVFGGFIADESLAVAFEPETSAAIIETLVPDSSRIGEDLVLEYIARRILSTLFSSWSGPRLNPFKFHARLQPKDISYEGVISVKFGISDRKCGVHFLLGPDLVGRLDGLWRRQIHSKTKSTPTEAIVRLEVAQLAVPPATVGDYTRSGTIVDLETPMSDTITMRIGTKNLLLGRIVQCRGAFAIETLAKPPTVSAVPAGTTRLAIELGEIKVDPYTYSEMSQPGSIIETAMPITDEVNVMIQGEKVATALLQSYRGNFAMTVK